MRFQFVCSAYKLARNRTVSSLMALTLGLVICLTAIGSAKAHEIRPAIADVTVGVDHVTLQLTLTLEPLVAGIDLQGLENTNAAPVDMAARNDTLRAMPPAELEQAFRDAWPGLKDGFIIKVEDKTLTPEISAITIPEAGDVALPRDSLLTLRVDLPEGSAPVTIGWLPAYGAMILRQVGADDNAYSALLDGGTQSAPLPRSGFATESAGTVFLRFIVQGFEHIIPKGLDHIVFVLGLFFFSLALKPMLVQVTSFTVAHTVTLALAALGYVSIPASIVEPLIAASIVFVAVENILRPQLGPWRTAVVFFFGLLHGLGFASVLGELGGGQASFFARLIGFNIGVEIGQLTVIAVAFLLVGVWFGSKSWYRSRIAIPASVLIALIGAYWFLERTVMA